MGISGPVISAAGSGGSTREYIVAVHAIPRVVAAGRYILDGEAMPISQQTVGDARLSDTGTTATR